MTRKIFICFLFLCVNLFSQDPFSAKITLNKQKISIDENLVIKILLSFPDNFEVDFHSLKNNLKPNLDENEFNLLTEKINRPIISNGSTFQEVIYTLEPWRQGKSYIAFLDVPFIPKEEKLNPVHVFGDILGLEVFLPQKLDGELVLADPISLDSTDSIKLNSENRKYIHQNKNRIDFEERRDAELFKRRVFSWKIFSFIALSFGLILAYRAKRKYVKKRKTEIIKESPSKKAMRAIDNLECKDLPSKQEFDAFYTELTGIVRVYIEGKYGLKAPEMTTQEFLKEAMKSTFFTSQTKVELAEFLSYSDLVKFAKQGSSKRECTEMLFSAKIFFNNF